MPCCCNCVDLFQLANSRHNFFFQARSALSLVGVDDVAGRATDVQRPAALNVALRQIELEKRSCVVSSLV